VPDLKKGPTGLFEVYVADGMIYSNRSAGGRLPENEEMIEKIRKYLERPDRPSMDDQGVPKEVPEGDIAGSGCT
jgi:predicted Rdx family selenoprotein